ncbi:MAG: molecular chaperone TorD family protein [Actinomycetota bacterium]
MTNTELSTDRVLAARGVVFALLAQLLGEDTRKLADGETTRALRHVLETLGENESLVALDRYSDDQLPDAETLAGRWVRWFDHGRVSPYEGSNVPVTAGGTTPRLADVAGFYKAFGMSVSGDRPDHIVAELEFMSLVTLAQADAIARGDVDGTEICVGIARAFVRDHIGCWLEGWVARVGEVEALRPWWSVAATAALFVRSEARLRNVVPLHGATILTADNDVPDDEDVMFSCSNECDVS